MKMIKIILIAVFVVACNTQDEVFELTEKLAAELLGLNVGVQTAGTASKEKRSHDGAAAARHALSKASGKIIIPIIPLRLPCPPLANITTGQNVCPSYHQLYLRFHSTNGNGFCYVLYPQWQRVYQTRCKCKICRNSCHPTVSPNFRNYCKPRRQRHRLVWVLCRKNRVFRFVRERITQFYGGCECRAYRINAAG